MTTVVVAVVVKQKGILGDSLLEIAEILFCSRRPASLGDSCKTWQSQILKQIVILHMLCPEGTLYTDVVFVQVCWNTCRNGHIVIYRLYIVCSVAGNLRFIGIGALATVDVVWHLRGNDRFHTILSGLQSTWLRIANLPTHHCTARAFYEFLISTTGCQALIPHYHSALLVALF